MKYCRGMGASLGGVNFFGSVVRLQRFYGSHRSRINRRSDMVSVTQPWVPTLATSLWSVSVSALWCKCTALEVLGLLV